MKKYNILNHYKSAHLEYYSDTSILYHPDIEQLNLSDDEISYFKENKTRGLSCNYWDY